MAKKRSRSSRSLICLLALVALILGAVLLVNQTSSIPTMNSVRNNVQNDVLNRPWTGKETPPVMTKASTPAGHETEMRERLQRINETCSRLNKTSGYMSELLSDRKRFAYCLVPKAGCTMWLRVLQYIAGQGRREDGPLSLSKYDIHYRADGFYGKYHVAGDTFNLSDTSPFRYMTVRDPYTRLWSAYVDKLLLPDFWATKGSMIIKRTRPGASKESLKCGNDVMFSEFISYVVQSGHDRSHLGQDKHWLPASDLCDPCFFNPDAITKIETFMKDFRYTLSQFNFKNKCILDSVTMSDPVDFEIEDVVDYNFIVQTKHKACADIKEVCRRMWTAFQYNGYIPPTEAIDDYVTKADVTKSDFLSAIRHVRTKFNVTSADKRRWRQIALEQAFSTVSREHKEALVRLYETDFELFGYSSRPDYF